MKGSEDESHDSKDARHDEVPHHIAEDSDLGRAIRIIWTDSGMSRDKGWASREVYAEFDMSSLTCETVGLWLGQDDDVVAVAQSRDEVNDNWLCAQIIWKPSIIRKEWL